MMNEKKNRVTGKKRLINPQKYGISISGKKVRITKTHKDYRRILYELQDF